MFGNCKILSSSEKREVECGVKNVKDNRFIKKYAAKKSKQTT